MQEWPERSFLPSAESYVGSCQLLERFDHLGGRTAAASREAAAEGAGAEGEPN